MLRTVKLEKNDTLYRHGDNADDLYFIYTGSIKLFTDTGYPFAQYSNGEMFGDSDALLNLPRDGKAQAITHLTLKSLRTD